MVFMFAAAAAIREAPDKKQTGTSIAQTTEDLRRLKIKT